MGEEKANSALILELPLLLKQELRTSLRPEIPLPRVTERETGNGEFHRLPNALCQPKGVLEFSEKSADLWEKVGIDTMGRKPNPENPALQLYMNHELRESSYQ